MLSVNELKNYASLRGLSIRDIEAYCNLGAGHISNILNGVRPLTEENHNEIVHGINSAYTAKLRGEFKRPALDKNRNAVKVEDNKDSETVTSSPKRSKRNSAPK